MSSTFRIFPPTSNLIEIPTQTKEWLKPYRFYCENYFKSNSEKN